MITRVYELHGRSERRFAELDAVLARCGKEAEDMESYLLLIEENLPEDMELDEDIVSWTEPLDNRTMNCEVKILEPGEATRARWITYKLKVNEPEEDWEW